MKPTNKFIIAVLTVAIILSLLLYKNSFGSYFFQDDWFSLKISQLNHFSDFIKFFIPRTDVIYYKPLGMQIPFAVLTLLFGINPLPFHLLALFTHIVNIIGIYFLIKKLSGRCGAALLSPFLYATSAIHFTQFYWAAAYSFVAGPAAFIYSVYFFISFIKARKSQYYFISFSIFLLGVFINEMVYILPLVISLYLLIFEKKKNLPVLIPYYSVLVFILLVRFVFFPVPVSGSYQWSIGKHILINLEAYILWSFNLPEEIKAQFISFGRLNPQFIHDFFSYNVIFISTFFISIIMFVIVPLIILVRKPNKLTLKYSILGVCWFIIGLLPVIFFPQHSFTYFLSIPFIGLIIFLTEIFSHFERTIYNKRPVFSIIFILIVTVNWLVGSYFTIKFNQLIYWAPRRADLSLTLIKEAVHNYPNYPQKGIIYVYDSSENKLALNNQDAFQIIYKSPRVKTLYSTEAPKPSILLK